MARSQTRAHPAPELRRARPGDARAVGPLILAAASSLELIYGDRTSALRAIETAYRAERTELSHRFGLVAEGDGIEGITIAFPGRLFGSLKLGTGVALARAAGARHLPDLIKRGRVLDRLAPPPRKDVLYVSVLSVAAARQGRGVATAMLGRAAAGAGRMGLDLCLDVALENEGAMALYERLGFHRVWMRETTEAERRLIPTTGSARYERPASAGLS